MAPQSGGIGPHAKQVANSSDPHLEHQEGRRTTSPTELWPFGHPAWRILALPGKENP